MEKAYSGKSVTFQDSNSKYTYLCIRQLFSCFHNLLNINEITKKKHIFVTNFEGKLHIFVTNFEDDNFITIFYSRMVGTLLYASAISLTGYWNGKALPLKE